MTSDQPPPDTGGQPPDPGEPLPPGQEVITVAGPWTVLSCVTAACTGCGTVPLDEDTSMTPHFASTSQAAQELTQNWGWHHKRGEWPKDDELLCPDCGAPPAAARTAPHAQSAPGLTPEQIGRAFAEAADDGWVAARPPGRVTGGAREWWPGVLAVLRATDEDSALTWVNDPDGFDLEVTAPGEPPHPVRRPEPSRPEPPARRAGPRPGRCADPEGGTLIMTGSSLPGDPVVIGRSGEFLCGGQTEDEAVAGAEQHAFGFLGDNAIISPARPA